MNVVKIIVGVIAMGLGVFGILNTIFLWVPMLVQGHEVTGQSTPKDIALRITAGIISLAIIAGGIFIIAS